MNRLKKEAARKYREAREGLTEAQIKEVDLQEARERKLRELTHTIHSEWFPEETDFMMDSTWDANDRKRGINPMGTEYIKERDAQRRARGVEPLGANGMPTTNKSWEVAAAEAKRRLKWI